MTGSVRDGGSVVQRITIDIPHPPASLSPNSRSHWRDKARDTRHMRTISNMLTCAAMGCADINEPWPAARMDIHWRFAGRQPDDDNIIARCKPIRDGIADAGLVADDCSIHVGSVVFERVPRRDVEVVITLTREDGTA